MFDKCMWNMTFFADIAEHLEFGMCVSIQLISSVAYALSLLIDIRYEVSKEVYCRQSKVSFLSFYTDA